LRHRLTTVEQYSAEPSVRSPISGVTLATVGAAPKWDDVKKMSDDDLRRHYDTAAEHTVVGTAFWREELILRAQMRATDEANGLNVEVTKLTRSIERMTRWLVVLTVVAILVSTIAVLMAAASAG
jgi:hypothetical protein